MNRRTALALLLGGAGLGAAAGTGTSVFRLHRSPNRTPYLTEAHLAALRATDLDRPRVLFIGNSMVINHDVPALTAARAAEDGVRLAVAAAAANGARLVETVRIPELEAHLQPGLWDVVVLQDFTKTPLRAPDRWGSLFAMDRIAARVGPTPIVLYPPWPAAARNGVYRDAGFLTATPRDPDDYAARTMAFYSDAAERSGFALAPVPGAWLDAGRAGADLYDEDGHHANARGAALAADTLWTTIRPVL